MDEKVVDLMAYKIEKSLIANGFEIKKDGDKKVKILLKVKSVDN
jgi:hypothetical protein